MTLSAQIAIKFNLSNQKALDLNTAKDIVSMSRGINFQNGTGANQANKLFHDTRPLGDAANETIDLHDGTLKDAFGDPLEIDKLKVLYIKNNSKDANLLVGGAAATQIGLFADVTDILKLPPEGDFFFSAPGDAGVDVTTNSDLKLEHDGTGSNGLTYDIVAVGVDVG